MRMQLTRKLTIDGIKSSKDKKVKQEEIERKIIFEVEEHMKKKGRPSLQGTRKSKEQEELIGKMIYEARELS